MTLTKAQHTILEDAKRRIDYAREHDFLHWASLNLRGYDLDKDWDSVPNPYLSNAFVLAHAQDVVLEDETGTKYFEPHYWSNRYEEEKKGVTIVHANSKTLEALARLNMIEIIHDGRSGIDTIRLLNY